MKKPFSDYFKWSWYRGTTSVVYLLGQTAAAAKSPQSCPTLCDPIDGSSPGSPVPGILQARTLEWVAISFSNAWKWKWSRSVMSDSSRPHGMQPTRLLHPWDSPGKSTGVGCHCLLHWDRLLPAKTRGPHPILLEAWLELCLFQPLMFHKRILREIRVNELSGKSLITFILNQYHSNCQNSLGHSLEIDVPQAPHFIPQSPTKLSWESTRLISQISPSVWVVS